MQAALDVVFDETVEKLAEVGTGLAGPFAGSEIFDRALEDFAGDFEGLGAAAETGEESGEAHRPQEEIQGSGPYGRGIAFGGVEKIEN